MASNNQPQGTPFADRSVAVIGVGALGCPAAELLVRAGAGRLTLVDPDVVELSNLQRQVLFDRHDLGRPKVEAARRALLALAPGAEIAVVQGRIEPANAAALLAGHDFVVDACDDPATKLLIDATAVAAGIVHAYGGVARTGGSALLIRPGGSACLSCVFPDLADDLAADDAESCSELGILAPVAGVIGALLAIYALDALAGPSPERERQEAGVLTTYDVRGRRWRRTRFSRNPNCTVCATLSDVASAERRSEACHS